MIHQIFIAPKQMPVEHGLQFAEENQLGYEIPGFVEPEILENPTSHLLDWETRLAPLNGLYALHGPVYDLNPVSFDPAIAEVSKRRYTQAVNIAKLLGCRYLVVHSQYSPLFAAANIKPEWTANTIQFWQQFAEDHLADSPSLSIVIENFMEEDPAQLRQLIDSIGHLQVKACLDTGHANIFSKASPIHWVNELEQQLVYIHSHNNYGHWDEHRGYKYGTLDMDGFLNHLMLLPYRVNLALEIFNRDELEESYQMVQRILEIQQEQLPEKTFLI